MKDLISEYILTFCEVIAGIGIILIVANYADKIMALIK